MKKIYYIYGLLFLLLLCVISVVFPSTFAFNYDRSSSVLSEVFSHSGAELVEANINIYSSSQDMFLGKEELESAVKLLTAEMNVDYLQSEKRENYSDGYNQLSLIGESEQGYNVAIICHSMDFESIDDEEGGVETNIVLDITGESSCQQILKTEKKAKKTVNNLVKGAKSASCIVGSFAGKMEQEDMIELIGSLFEKANAKEVEKAVYDGMISVSGYTPGIDEYIKFGEDMINFNVAMRYNSYEEKTYIWIGSPVISLEY